MISSVSIQNLRGIREGKLEGLTPLTVLVGPNSSGKSTVLDGLLIGGHPEPAEAIARVARRRGSVQRGTRWLFWRSRDQQQVTISIKSETGAVRTVSVARRASNLSFGVTTMQKVGQGSTGGALTLTPQNQLASGSHGRVMPLDDVTEVHLVEPHGGVDPPPLHRIWSRAREAGRMKDVDALLRDLLPGLEKIEILTDEDDPVVYLSYSDHSVPAGLAGDGVQSLVRLSLELAAAPGGVVLIEEPEAHEHPGAIRQSAKAIAAAVRRGVQVIITTHSLELIDMILDQLGDKELGLLSLFSMRLEDGNLVSSRLEGADVLGARGEIKEDLR